MGITVSDITLLEKALEVNPDIQSVIELGSQNLYLPGLNHNKPPFASQLYEARGMKYSCIDLAGDNNAMTFNLAFPFLLGIKFDLVTDFGTSEHLVQIHEFQTVAFHEGHINSVYPHVTPSVDEIKKGYYSCWVNKHNLLKVGGIMISVNPKTGHWIDHGYTYITQRFYKQLSQLMGYEILWLNENAAMGNDQAVNIECILRKVKDTSFITFDEFQECEQLLK